MRELLSLPGSSILYGIAKEADQFGFAEFDLISPPSRFFTPPESAPPVTYRSHEASGATFPTTPAELLRGSLDNWQPMSRRSVARLFAWFLVAEDPQRRFESREVQTLAHQASLVRYVLDEPRLSRVLIGDEVGLGKTVEAALIVKSLLEARPGLRVLYLAPARLVSNVAREFDRMKLGFRRWVAGEDRDGNLHGDGRLIASIHRAAFPSNLDEVVATKPWDLLIVDECHHLSAYGSEDGKKAVKQYQLVERLIKKLPDGGRVVLMSGTPHQGNATRFNNLLALLRAPGEDDKALTGRVIYRTKEDVKGWDDNPLFPLRDVHPALVISLSKSYEEWLTEIHSFYSDDDTDTPQATQRAVGWRCGQALQWAASSVQAGLGYLIRQAIRAGWTADAPGLADALSAIRPYRRGKPDEALGSLWERLEKETRSARAVMLDDVEEDDAPVWVPDTQRLTALLKHGVALLHSFGDSKWMTLKEQLLDAASNEQFVLFAQPIETVTALANFLKRVYGEEPAIIIGGQSDEERNAEVMRFWSGQTRFLVSSRAGNEGINLQCAHRLVHVDVPWNPMDLEQRVGRVHRFGSKQTIIVDTLILEGSREAHVYKTAHQKLRAITNDLTLDPAKFEELFARVMNLVPPAELHTILSDEGYGPLNESDSNRLAAMVEAGLNSWNSFNEKFKGEHQIAQLNPGQASWADLDFFATQYARAKPAQGYSLLGFTKTGKREVAPREQPLRVLELNDGSFMACADIGGMPLQGPKADKVLAGGLNVPAISEALKGAAFPEQPSGAAFLRYGDARAGSVFTRPPGPLGVFVGARLSLRQSQAAGWQEGPVELHSWTVGSSGESAKLSASAAADLIRDIAGASLRTRPIEVSAIIDALAVIEADQFSQLKRPSEAERITRFTFALVPLFAGVISA